jgi:hypothetical protein
MLAPDSKRPREEIQDLSAAVHLATPSTVAAKCRPTRENLLRHSIPLIHYKKRPFEACSLLRRVRKFGKYIYAISLLLLSSSIPSFLPTVCKIYRSRLLANILFARTRRS